MLERKNLMVDTYKSWDAHCKQCGRCCYENLEDGRGKIIYTQSACHYLNPLTNTCTIFAHRFELNPHCVQLTPELVPLLHWLPAECGYRPSPSKFTRKTNRERRKRSRRRIT